jgi:hypothetical protein
MNKVIDYRIARNNNTEDLMKNVKEWLALGYQPIGGVGYSPETRLGVSDPHYEYFFQAMVKYSNE